MLVHLRRGRVLLCGIPPAEFRQGRMSWDLRAAVTRRAARLRLDYSDVTGLSGRSYRRIFAPPLALIFGDVRLNPMFFHKAIQSDPRHTQRLRCLSNIPAGLF